MAIPEGIYGVDNRKDLYQIADPAVLKLADATVALVDSAQLRLDPASGRYRPTMPLETLGNPGGENICKGERFVAQPLLSSCSGALVGPDLVLTASHCISIINNCAGKLFVFGFGVRAEGKVPTSFAASEVYTCKSIVGHGYSHEADFAVLKLDRTVIGHAPLKISRKGPVPVGTPLMVIGHPTGLPVKVAAGARVRAPGTTRWSFASDLDTFPGNSGSPVFNASTGLIEGVLVGGEGSYAQAPKRECNVPVRFTQDEGESSNSIYVSYAAEFIP